MYLDSVYTLRPDDPQAVYVEPDGVSVFGDGVHDDTQAIQDAICRVKNTHNFGIVFLREGTYLISKTLFIPKAVRLIGFGEKRPKLVLKDNAPGFDTFDETDKLGGHYMVWFVDAVPKAGEPIRDANPGTFYSALSNVDLKIGQGNPCAVALRAHYAQHCFLSHCAVDAGDGLAGLFDAGNEMENMCFTGGDYGIITTKCSPGWPLLVVDSHFSGQRKAAIRSRELGLTALRLRIENAPRAIETFEGFMDKILLEDCTLSNITGPALTIQCEKNTFTQWNLRNVLCERVPLLASFPESGREVKGLPGAYRVERFTHGVQMEEMEDSGDIRTDVELSPLDTMPEDAKSDIPALPNMASWVNVRTLGAKGDNTTDDTAALQAAIDQYEVLYIPQGWYRVTDTLKLKENTKLIGLNPISTQLVLPDNAEAFGGPGPAKALIESGRGGDNLMNGIGVDAGARNPRVTAVKWMAGEKSYMNDVKFIGGHGCMSPDPAKPWVPSYNPSRTGDVDPDRKWDSQYWSLWVTEQGGGVFKDIWSASTYAAAGFYASDTSTRGRVYCMSVEHHVRNEVKFKGVTNWKVYALQTEEEVAESQQCLPLELIDCHDMTFSTYYSFRVIWLPNPYPCAVRLWNSGDIEWLNLHNYTQVKYTLTNMMEEPATGREVRPWQIARFVQKRSAKTAWPTLTPHKAVRLFGGFEFADAACADREGNFYFCDGRYDRIYRIDAADGRLSLVRDVPLRPLSLAFDTENNLLVVAEFIWPKGATRDGKPIRHVKPADAAGTSYGDWYISDAVVVIYTMDPADPENTMRVLEKRPSGEIPQVAQALHPANRWRDNNDYLVSTVKPTAMSYLAPDGKTAIPDYYDLIRSNSLLAAVPGETFLAVDEYYKRVVAYDVEKDGFLKNSRVFAEHGEYSLVNDLKHDRVYVADGDVLVYNGRGELLERIPVPQRPATLALGGRDGRTLLVTARSEVYAIQL